MLATAAASALDLTDNHQLKDYFIYFSNFQESRASTADAAGIFMMTLQKCERLPNLEISRIHFKS